MSERWKIDELAQLVQAALQTAGYDGQQSARVRSLPDPRTIRYYTTLGLLDKPAEMRGRTAFYGRRHVLQLVAIKRLQARGLSLVDVQQSLAGADERKLVRWAGLPEGFWETAGATAEPAPPSPDELLAESGPEEERCCGAGDRAGERFWAAAPEASQVEEERAEHTRPCKPPVSPRSAVHLQIRPGVTLVVEAADWGRVGEQALAELTPALESLLEALRRAGLVPPDAPQPKSGEPNPKHPTEEDEEPT